jgi:eukaryotic-like serine/threonine-protein kinase
MTASPEDWQRIKELFDAALEAEPARRSSLLQERCSDVNVRAEVERLLREHDQAWSFLSSPVIGSLTSDNLIGPQERNFDSYHLIERIGEGGMGEVWLAEQREPVRRRVAIKLIKAGMDTREVVARFESERQALALMDHPSIAKVFDAGSTPEGRPYFVMEYVPGIPITIYCDRHKLTTRERMELFIQVCEGVQHAHQKAIIHRDLKPSNILVSEVDGKPIPRIIDFGLAKATSQRLTDGSIYTRVGAVLGTLEYMSPEQADSGGEDIDTRTDVYSLGVVLYQLLAGALPLDLKKLAYEEVLHRIREQDVPRPSSRILSKGEDSAITAQNRGTDPPSLTRQLRGDPDALVLKALEKDRKRRYGSPAELAADIGRYLHNEPVAAHPPSAAYRARKYLRRHRMGVALAGVGLLLLIGFAITEAVQLRRITEERDRATRERDRADRITQFMTGMFKVSDPSESRGNTVTAREILDKAANEIETGLSNDSVLQAKMMYTMGVTYLSLGLFSRAQLLLERTVEIQTSVLGPRHPDTLTSKSLLAHTLTYEGRYAEAEKLARETVEVQQQVLGSRNQDTLRSNSTLAVVLTREGRYAEAEKLARETLDIQRQVLGPEHRDTLDSMNNLAGALEQDGRHAEAEQLWRETLDTLRRVLGPEHPDTLTSMQNLGVALKEEGRYVEAEKLQRETLDIDRRIFGIEHPRTALLMLGLAETLLAEGRYAESEELFHKTFEIQRHILGPDHPSTLNSLEYEAINLSHEGRYSEAKSLFGEAIESARKAGQPSVLAAAWYNFACGAAVAGHHDEAFTYLGQAIDHGIVNSESIESDSDLKSLHGDPRFDALLTRAREAATPKTR